MMGCWPFQFVTEYPVDFQYSSGLFLKTLGATTSYDMPRYTSCSTS